jgi:hypothetical protein
MYHYFMTTMYEETDKAELQFHKKYCINIVRI